MNITTALISVGIMVIIGLFILYVVLTRFRTTSTLDNNNTVTGQMTSGPPNFKGLVTQVPLAIEYVKTVDNILLSTTGDSDNMPPLEITLATQRGELLSVLPLETEFFQITMDYKLAKYIVTFRDENNQDNYSGLKIEEFILK